MQKRLFLTITMFAFAAAAHSAWAANFLYLIDTSSSMRANRAALIATVCQDLERAVTAEPAQFKAGDQILIWTFDARVTELKRYEFDPASAQNFSIPVHAELARVNMQRTTSIGPPLRKAFEQFRAPESGDLHVFLYTDGRDAAPAKEVESVLRLYAHAYKPALRLQQVQLTHFGERDLPKPTIHFLAALGARIQRPPPITETRPPSPPAPSPTPAPDPAPIPPPEDTVISVSPERIHLSAAVAPEFIKTVPLEFKISPAKSGLSIGVALEATDLPGEMVLTTTADHLATEGRQSISFLLQDPQPGRYSATLILSSSVKIEPAAIPVEIEILPPKPLEIGFQFYPERPALLELPANGAWQKLPNAGASLFYPDNLKEILVRFDAQTPPGLEVQLLPADPSATPIAPGQNVKLADLGRVVTFHVREVSADAVGKDLAVQIGLQVQPDQNVTQTGSKSLTAPVRFAPQSEIEIETREIALGEISRQMKSVKVILKLRVKGRPETRSLRLVKQGSGLNGLIITPSEIALKPGPMTVDLEFTGFDDRQPGPIEGAFVLVPAERAPATKLLPVPIQVRGTMLAPASLMAEIENPMVSGKPILIRARFDTREQGSIRALIHSPDSSQPHEVVLSDNGSAEDGDAQANDGIYSAFFKQTTQLGNYEIKLSAQAGRSRLPDVALTAPIYFKTPAAPLSGQMAMRRDDELIELKPKLVSEFPGEIAISADSSSEKAPLHVYLSNKTLNPGENTLDLVVRLTPEARPGQYKYQLTLVTDTIAGTKAEIPIAIEIKVLSFLQYFVRLLAVALALALAAAVVIMKPWRRRARNGRARLTEPSRLGEHEFH